MKILNKITLTDYLMKKLNAASFKDLMRKFNKNITNDIRNVELPTLERIEKTLLIPCGYEFERDKISPLGMVPLKKIEKEPLVDLSDVLFDYSKETQIKETIEKYAKKGVRPKHRALRDFLEIQSENYVLEEKESYEIGDEVLSVDRDGEFQVMKIIGIDESDSYLPYKCKSLTKEKECLFFKSHKTIRKIIGVWE